MSRVTVDVADRVDQLQQRLGHVFIDQSLPSQALMHRSFCAENAAPDGSAFLSYERLEFLGDAVLELVTSDHIFEQFPHYSEGQLAKLRAAIVNESVLADVARQLNLGELVLLGVGESRSGGHDKSSILADVVESSLGALYLDGGLATAERWCAEYVLPIVDRVLSSGDGSVLDDAKSRLLEAVQARGGTIEYVVTSDGPAHEPSFMAKAIVDGVERGSGVGRTKRNAEYAAAEMTLGLFRK
jgi:ribonuclease-3